MQIRRLLIIVLGIFSVNSHAEVMSNKPKTSLRAYVKNVSIEETSLHVDKRYGLDLTLQTPVPVSSLAKFIGFGLLLNMTPDWSQKSESVDIRQNFYSASLFLSLGFTYLFRYTLLLGPGALWSQTRSNILNEKTSRNQISPLFSLGLQIDYAISENWGVSFMLLSQRRFEHAKTDWQRGLGVSYSF